MHLFLFEISGQRYGLDLADVQEVVAAVTLAPLPGASAAIEGILNMRGCVIPVFDIRQRLSLPHKPISYTDQLVVARTGARLLAFRVDRALGIADIDDSDAQSTNNLACYTRLVSGIAEFDDGIVLIQDLRALVSDIEVGESDDRRHPACER